MFLINSFTLSFSVLWRLILLLPIIVILYIIYMIVAFILGAILSWLVPALGILLSLAVFLAANVIPVMIAIRLGLRAKGEEVTGKYTDLSLPAIGYGFVEGFGIVVLSGLVLGGYVLMSPQDATEVLRFLEGAASLTGAELLRLEETLPFTTVAFIFVAIASAIRAAILVPMAASSAGAGMYGRSYPFLWKFGAGFVPLFILVAIYQLSPFFMSDALEAAADFIGQGDALRSALFNLEQLAEGDSRFISFGAEEAIVIGLFILTSLWLFCLHCAAAALVFVDQRDSHDLAEAAEKQAQQASPDDIRSLRKSRS
ncbi:hypothetical protein [Pseudaestuariivita rosea]|uniref:hypothetical protein n=1 Tax=Pseudaestuariivita rosea TaxID=2763263 RepID=UPI001ABA5EF6|nr:hypothetical protein [Pseudaestuariivita rosea]